MAKLDVGVGDEFPTEEIRRDENGVVHHYHYYYRRPRHPFGFLRVVLVLLMIGLVLRLFHEATWMDFDLPWLPHGYMRFAGTLLAILIVGFALYALRRQDYPDRR